MKARPIRLSLLAIGLVASAAAASAQTGCSFYQTPTVAFADGADSLHVDLSERFDPVYTLLYRCPEHGLVLTGTADSTEAAPVSLAERRAAAVAAALVADGFSSDRLSTVSGGVGEGRRSRQVSIEAVALTDLPGWTRRGRGHEPDPVEQTLLAEDHLLLDWAQDPDGCDGDAVGAGRLVLAEARYTSADGERQDLAVRCIRSSFPGARYAPSRTAEVTDGVTVIDGTMGSGSGARSVGWLAGPSGSVQTDGRFCARYTAAYGEVLHALAALAAAPGDGAAEAAVGTAVDALWPFADAVAAVGAEVQVMALDCRQTVFYEQAL